MTTGGPEKALGRPMIEVVGDTDAARVAAFRRRLVCEGCSQSVATDLTVAYVAATMMAPPHVKIQTAIGPAPSVPGIVMELERAVQCGYRRSADVRVTGPLPADDGAAGVPDPAPKG